METKKFLYPNFSEGYSNDNVSGNLYSIITKIDSMNANIIHTPKINNISSDLKPSEDIDNKEVDSNSPTEKNEADYAIAHQDNSDDAEYHLDDAEGVDIEYIKEESYQEGYNIGYEKCREEMANNFDYGMDKLFNSLKEKINALDTKDFDHIYNDNISKVFRCLCDKFFAKLPIDIDHLVQKMLLEHISKIRQYSKIEIIAQSSIADKIKSHISTTSIKDRIVYNITNNSDDGVRIIIDDTQISFCRKSLVEAISNLLDNK